MSHDNVETFLLVRFVKINPVLARVGGQFGNKAKPMVGLSFNPVVSPVQMCPLKTFIKMQR